MTAAKVPGISEKKNTFEKKIKNKRPRTLGPGTVDALAYTIH